MNTTNVIATAALALLGCSTTQAADVTAQDLAIRPSCVVYASDSGPRAHIDGSIVDAANRPRTGQRQQFVVDGHRYEAITGADGIYSADVPVFSAHPTIRETQAIDSTGQSIPGQLGRARCVTPQVRVGPLQAASPPLGAAADSVSDGAGS